MALRTEMDLSCAETEWGVGLDEYIATVMCYVAASHGVRLAVRQEVLSGAEVEARINHGRWLVDCDSCKSAESVWLSNPVFMCQSCWNKASGGRWRRVVLPEARADIESALIERPDLTTRNWFPGETVDSIKRENEDHGITSGATSTKAQDGLDRNLKVYPGELTLWLRSIRHAESWLQRVSVLVVVMSIGFGVATARVLPTSHSIAVVGLLMEGWGALLIALPLMRRGSEIAWMTAPRLDFNPPLIRSLLQDRTRATIGLAFLVAGFACQTTSQLL